jgi:hypothetical protein
MAELRHVGVREFRDHATSFLSGSEPIAVNKYGRVIGFYIPVARDDEDVARALARVAASVERILAESGMSEDELVALLDLQADQAS